MSKRLEARVVFKCFALNLSVECMSFDCIGINECTDGLLTVLTLGLLLHNPLCLFDVLLDYLFTAYIVKAYKGRTVHKATNVP